MIDLLYPMFFAGIGGGGITHISATTGTNAYIASHEDIDEYEELAAFVTFSSSNTGNVTLNINNLGARGVFGDNDVQLKPGEILANSTHLVVSIGNRFKLISQRAILSAAQLATTLTGLSRNVGTTSDIAATDTILQAFGKAISLASPITGYAVGANTPLAAADTLRVALGKLQGQINTKQNNIEIASIDKGYIENAAFGSTIIGQLGSPYNPNNISVAIAGAAYSGTSFSGAISPLFLHVVQGTGHLRVEGSGSSMRAWWAITTYR
jgi:hypothetical protein